jgi:hypothetical protein
MMTRFVIDLAAPQPPLQATLACRGGWVESSITPSEVLEVLSTPEIMNQAIRASGIHHDRPERLRAAWAGRLRVEVYNEQATKIIRVTALPVGGLSRAQAGAVLDQLVQLYALWKRRDALESATHAYDSSHEAAEAARTTLTKRGMHSQARPSKVD